MPIESDLRAQGCPLDRIMAQHQPLDMSGGGECGWLVKGWARASVVGWLLRTIDEDFVDRHAPKTDAEEEDAEKLAGVAEMMGMAPRGQGLALVLGIGAGGKGGPDAWAMLEGLVAMAWEVSEAVGSSGLAHKSQLALMGEIARVASTPVSADGDSVIFSNSVSGILRPLPADMSMGKEVGMPKGKQWVKGLEEELNRVDEGNAKARARIEDLRCACKFKIFLEPLILRFMRYTNRQVDRILQIIAGYIMCSVRIDSEILFKNRELNGLCREHRARSSEVLTFVEIYIYMSYNISRFE